MEVCPPGSTNSKVPPTATASSPVAPSPQAVSPPREEAAVSSAASAERLRDRKLGRVLLRWVPRCDMGPTYLSAAIRSGCYPLNIGCGLGVDHIHQFLALEDQGGHAGEVALAGGRVVGQLLAAHVALDHHDRKLVAHDHGLGAASGSAG